MRIQPVTITLFIGLLAGCATEPGEEPARTDLDSAIVQPPPREIAERRLPATEAEAAKGSIIALSDQYSDPAIAAFPAGVLNPSIRQADRPLYRERYQHPGDHHILRVTEQPVSTFSVDVDTGAYSNTRRWLNQGRLPPEDAVRVEEFVNYFDYAYAQPETPDTPFRVNTEIAPTPWNPQTHLLRIGIQGYAVPAEQLPNANLVFLVDVSGSMQSEDKLPLLRNALSMLVGELDADDSISLVVYAGASGIVLPPTPGDQKARIIAALQALEAGGSTNGGAGIELAYRMARQNFHAGGVNRVILATDGDFNVGIANTEELVDFIQRQRDAGIALTTLGFGSGNYNDHLMEQLADEGNGNYAYIDRLSEARKVLSQELSATLLTIASDVKIQVEFNPAAVTEYRLIGYENRVLNESDFSNDRIDAGEIGAGHRVTALYELSLTGSDGLRLPPRRYETNALTDKARTDPSRYPDELAHLRIRYKRPGESTSQLIAAPILRHSILPATGQASEDFRFAAAVAAFGQKLRGGSYLQNWGWKEISELAAAARGHDVYGYRGEFQQLVALAQTLATADRLSRTDR
jgi:Ca-activated chloride channel family protein